MTESLCTNAIHQALLALERNDAQSWCCPLVDVLESLRVGSSIDWCVEVIAQTLGREVTANDARPLMELRRLVDQKSSRIELLQRGHDIWYSKDLRTAFQTATAKTYEAAAAFFNGNDRHYKRGIAYTVSGIALAGMTSSSDQLVHRVLEIFKCRCDQLNSEGSDKNNREP